MNMVAAEFDLIRMATDLSSLIRAFGCDLDLDLAVELVLQRPSGDADPV